MKLIFLGPPGAGKGTQAAGVSAHLKVPHISTGDMLRAGDEERHPHGLAGQAVSWRAVSWFRTRSSLKWCASASRCRIARTAICSMDFPARWNRPSRWTASPRRTRVVNIDVPDERLLARLAGRRVCVKWQRHIQRFQARGRIRLPVCGGKMIQRDDDKPETIAKRLRVYHEQTAPLIGYYEGQASSAGSAWKIFPSSTATAVRRMCSRPSSLRWSESMITIKSEPQIEKMRSAGALLHSVLEALRAEIQPGVTTAHLDQLAERLIREAGGVPRSRGLRDFPIPSVLLSTIRWFTALPAATGCARASFSALTAAAFWMDGSPTAPFPCSSAAVPPRRRN